MQQAYRESLDQSHHGHPALVETVYTDGPGRPAYRIDPNFLQWAYTHRSTSAIARFLGISRRAVRNALIANGIAQPQLSPFLTQDNNGSESQEETGISDEQELEDPQADFLLDPILPIQQASGTPTQQITSFTGPLSMISNSDLDSVILQLRQQFTRAGITMLHGMLRQLGYRIPRERIRQSLYRIDPVHRIFGRIRIRRRVYSVAGPNALWHHDGQHGR